MTIICQIVVVGGGEASSVQSIYYLTFCLPTCSHHPGARVFGVIVDLQASC